ncbi:MAG: helix-turn-helix domain-containing protein [Treponema sp.]
MSNKKDVRVVDVIERIRGLRVSKKISIEELATRANISRSYIYYIETKKKIPTLSVLFRLADAIGADITDFFSSCPVPQVVSVPDKVTNTKDDSGQIPELFKIFSYFNMLQKKTYKPRFLSWKELYLLLYIENNGSSSISSLAENLDMSVLDISRMVSDLKSRNILQKKIKSSDHRVVLSVLTDTGLMLLEKNKEMFRTFLADKRKTFSDTYEQSGSIVGSVSYSGQMQCSFKPLFNMNDEIIDLEFIEANQSFVCEFPKIRMLKHTTLLSHVFYQHFDTILSACNTVWTTGKSVSITLDTGSSCKEYICKFSRNTSHIVISAESAHKTAYEYIHELLPYYDYFFTGSPAKMIVECATGRILEVNDEAIRFYGWSRRQFVQKTIYEISMSRSSVIRSQLDNGEGNGNGTEEIFHTVHRIADGSMKRLEVHIASSKLDETKIKYVTVIQDTSGGACFPAYNNSRKEKNVYSENFQAFSVESDGTIAGMNELFRYLNTNGRLYCYSAGDHFFEYGTLLPTFGFILKGIFRVYYGTPSGHEYTLEYLKSGSMIDSLNFSTDPSGYEIIIEAVVPCEVLVINQNLFKRRAAVDPHAFEFLYYLEKKRLSGLVNHVMLLLTDNAKERYKHFIQNESNTSNYLSGQDIASYLGITPETLSRIKNTD